ncbi:MAG: alpha/beta hydrolase [Gammaproteobacteria bacterium]|nr:alpha/beta hydrolase [Gammaproteobacteria bacterium]
MDAQRSIGLVGLVGFLLWMPLGCNHLDENKLYFSSFLNISYGAAENVDPALTSLDIHVPRNARDAPVLVFVHGGSWAFGDKHLYHSTKLPFLLSLGYVVVSPNYRLSTDTIKHPNHVNDVAAALRWTVDNIKNFGGDPGGIYLMGHSAGAHLVSLLTLSDEFLTNVGLDQSRIQGVVMVDTAAYDMVKTMESLSNTPSSYFHKAFGKKLETWIHASPLHQIQENRDYPPFLVLVASPVLMPIADQLKTIRERKWERVVEFSERLRQTGASVYTVDAMQYKSHRTINEHLGNRRDLPTSVLQQFLEFTEASRTDQSLPQEPSVASVFSVQGSEWHTARRDLGDYTADVVIRFRDQNGDNRIDRSELQGIEVTYFEGWDLDSDGAISKEDIVRGYEKLEPN